MMRAKLLFLAAVSFSSVACYPTQYSHIEQVEGGYMVTKNQAGFFRVHGELFFCKPNGEQMICTEVGTD
jgi:hypothetical protein